LKSYDYWFRQFKSSDFYLKDKERSGQPKEVGDVFAELQALLDENSARMLEELTKALNVDKSIISDHYTQWNRFKKKANKFHMNCLN